MQTFSTNAINLKSFVLNETDRIIVMYSEDNGLIRCVAKGVKKTKSKLGGRMEMLVANKLLLRKGKNLDTVAQADTINSFYKIRQDMDKMMYAIYCAEIIMNFGVENDPSAKEVYNLSYNCFQKISDSKTTVEVLLAVLRFQLQMLQIIGYALELDGCANCSTCVNDEGLYFSTLGGGVLCANCAKKYPHSKKMNVKLKNFLQALTNTDFYEKTMYDELANEKITLFCFDLLKEYISQFSSRKFKTLSAVQECCCV